jgi:predicted DNA-binding antitoxin AbrB/MazE fold protein
MTEIIPAIYENGVLRPLIPLALPEHTAVEIQIVKPASVAETERQRVHQVLAEAGVIRPQVITETIQPVSETELTAAAQALGQAGPLSALIIAERAGR